MKKYRIKIDNDVEIERLMCILFRHGYVFTTSLRIRTFERIKLNYINGFSTWKYFITGYDPICSNVFGAFRNDSISISIEDYQEVKIEEFLQLNG